MNRLTMSAMRNHCGATVNHQHKSRHTPISNFAHLHRVQPTVKYDRQPYASHRLQPIGRGNTNRPMLHNASLDKVH